MQRRWECLGCIMQARAGAKDFLECGGPDAYFGTPAQATAEEGHRLFEILADVSEAALEGGG